MLERPEERIQQSWRTLKGWAWLSTICSDRDEIVDILGQEVRALGEIAFEHPCHAAKVAELIKGYIALASLLAPPQQGDVQSGL